MVVSSDGVVVVGSVVDGVGVVVVAVDIVVVDGGVAGAGALLPLPRARMARP